MQLRPAEEWGLQTRRRVVHAQGQLIDQRELELEEPESVKGDISRAEQF